MEVWAWVAAAYLAVYGVTLGYGAVLHRRLREARRRLERS